MNQVPIGVIIPAAGNSLRMGSATRKPFLKLHGKEILFYTIEKFARVESVQEIVLAVNPADIEFVREEWKERLADLKVHQVVVGGLTRAMSVNNALFVMNEDSQVILIHDAVRPFVSEQVILEVANSAMQHGAAVAAAKVKDTVKEAAENNIVKRTVPRENLWLAQTPQGFRRDIILSAYRKANLLDPQLTDDAFMVEQTSTPVHIVPDSPFNFKITTPEDLAFAERFISG